MMADLDRATWELAIAEAGDGAPGLLALLLRAGNPPGDDLREAVAALLERRLAVRLPTEKQPTRKPYFSPDQADRIRRIFHALTAADPHGPRGLPVYSDTVARSYIGDAFHVSPETIRNVVERTKTYREH